MLKRDVVKKYLAKYPDMKKLALAKLICKENKGFKVEATRGLINTYTGSMGEIKRNYIKDNRFVRPLTYDTNPYSLPTSYEEKRVPYILPKSCNRILFISDIHIPYHSVESTTLALAYAKKKGVNTILLGGDILDFYQLSDHEKTAGKRDTALEIELCKQFLGVLKEHFPECKIFFKEGNHDLRLERFLMRMAPQLIGIQEFRLERLLGLKELGIEWIGNKQLIKAGKLNILHGNEIKGGGEFVSKRFLDKAGDNILSGDKHRVQEFFKTDINGSVHAAWNVGCLCELSPDYLPFTNNWMHGFAIIDIEESGEFTVENKKIINGKVL